MKTEEILESLVILAVGLLAIYAIFELFAINNLRAEVYDAGVSRIGLTSADLTIRIRFTNPFLIDTPSFHGEFDVYLDGVYVGHLTLPETKVPFKSSVTQSAILTVSYSEAVRAILSNPTRVTLRGKIYYRLLGIIP
ncbi:MAG: hypothetical protein ACPLZG_13350, partial [Thermoproteota archaeon]